jgi:AbrB family looped-hinge helix DNA binding protein
MLKAMTKVSSKGQLVLPKEIREKLDIKKGDFLVIEIAENTLIMKKKEGFLDYEALLPPLKIKKNSIRDFVAEEMVKDVI